MTSNFNYKPKLLLKFLLIDKCVVYLIMSQVIRNLVKLGKWEELLDLSTSLTEDEKIGYLWAWPLKTNLKFLKNILSNFNINTILSIGCGTGLLEWIIKKSTGKDDFLIFQVIFFILHLLCTGINVYGIETDKPWWDSIYSIKPFIELNFLESDLTSEFLKKSVCRNDWNFALLFCYFNNRKAFLEYMKMYKGNCVIIIGPGEGRYTYTDPDPFQPQFDDNDKWMLQSFCEIGSTKDFIVVYAKANQLTKA